MNEDIYVLKKAVKQKVIDNLNIRVDGFSPVYRIYKAIGKMSPDEDYLLSEETFIDIIRAAYSRKKIINPLSPREEIKKITNKYYPKEGKFLITSHDYEILLFYARKAVSEADA
jgi:hypothetical protein